MISPHLYLSQCLLPLQHPTSPWIDHGSGPGIVVKVLESRVVGSIPIPDIGHSWVYRSIVVTRGCIGHSWSLVGVLVTRAVHVLLHNHLVQIFNEKLYLSGVHGPGDENLLS